MESLLLLQDHFLLRVENLLFVITATVSGILLLWSLVSQRGIKEVDRLFSLSIIKMH